MMETRFKIVYTEEAYEFIHSLPEKVQDKIAYNIFKSRVVIDKELFKKLEGTDIWEFRTLYNGICYRLLAFWDTEEDTLVIATHGFIKKTQKTPSKEIDKAENIRKQYFNDKKQKI
ncbi:MAG: type II toxin-antitoxin system RelE/ParE family toxin [Phocaeicola vulgatus]